VKHPTSLSVMRQRMLPVHPRFVESSFLLYESRACEEKDFFDFVGLIY